VTDGRETPEFPVGEVPFSYFGSWLDLSRVIGQHVVAQDVHLVSHRSGFHPVLRLVPQAHGRRVETEHGATPARLRWRHPDGEIRAAFESVDTLRLAGRGLAMAVVAADDELTPFTGAYFFQDPVDGAHVLTSYETGLRYRITVLSGSARSIGTQALGRAERGLVLGEDLGDWEIAIEEGAAGRGAYRPKGPFDRICTAAGDAFGAFLDAVAPWRDDETPAAALAAYALWSATVRPAGELGRDAVLMSKHWMDKVWSWDHCFNAIALAGLPDLAWDQFLLPFDHQDELGALPDSVAHSEVLRNFVKPPIHGWALAILRAQAGDPDRATLLEVYHRLAAWSRFWLDHRRAPGSDLPYYQHGNDSGWDNATTFDPERVIESGDLAAFLVLQLRELARLAADLGLAAAGDWDRTAADLLTAMIDQLWDGERFVARGALSRRTWSSSSLLDLMPVVVAESLPAQVRAAVVAGLQEHLTPHGLATELPASPQYQDDGYWRGPVWAPATVLIEDGLRRAGHADLADIVSRRFRRLCERSGFAENFDARTGAGLRDRAYTWTASSYLILAAGHQARRAAAIPQDVSATGSGSAAVAS
jgi:hypothetical protein